MKQVLGVAGCAILLLSSPAATAQTSLDVIQDDLRQVKEQHDQATTELMTNFLTTLQQAAESGATALDLFQKAGGSLPDAQPVKTRYVYETPTEKAQREAIDDQNYQQVAVVIEVHCGLMRQAALLTLKPNDPQTRAEFIAWLKATAQTYPQLAGHRALKDVAMRDSVVTNYLGFHGWGDGAPGGWSVTKLPDLYHDLVLQPLRTPPTPEVLEAWDTYTAMRHADEPDRDKWAQEEPVLAFDRASDDFALQPTMDKLATLDGIIKANPTSDHLDEWVARMQRMITAYRGGGAAPGALPAATPGTTSSELAGTLPAASPGQTSAAAAGALPTASPGETSSSAAGVLPAASPGAPSSAAAGVLPAATPGIPSSAAAGVLPAATPGVPSSAAPGVLPAATPGQPSSAAPGPLPAPTPSTPSSTPGTP